MLVFHLHVVEELAQVGCKSATLVVCVMVWIPDGAANRRRDDQHAIMLQHAGAFVHEQIALHNVL
jgi:hypothetical protein